MNKLLFLIGAALLAPNFSGSACATNLVSNFEMQENQVVYRQNDHVIKGKISGLEAQDTLLVRTKTASSSVAVKNGVFEYTFTGNQAEVVNFFLSGRKLPNGKFRPFYRKPISVLMFPNTSVQVEGNFDVYQVSGSKFYNEYNKMNKPILENDKKRGALNKEFLHIARSANADKQKMAELRKEMAALVQDNEKIMVEFIKQNPGSQVSVFLLYCFHPKAGEQLIDQIDQEVQNGELGHLYKESKDFYHQMAIKREAAKKIQAGKIAPDFTLKDINGKDFSLSSLKDKYVILDFWGSWCGWCIKGMPKMKEMYEKYKGKLEIVGIDCRDVDSKWKAAVAKHAIPWINVINDPKHGKNMISEYNVSGFPTKIILNPDRTIFKVVVGEDPAFYSTIDSLMK